MLQKKTILLLAFSLLILLTSAYSQGKKTGLEGYIFRITGNRMPSPDAKLSPPKGIKAVLYIYELTSLSQVTKQGESAFYSSIRTRLVQTVTSNENGYFFASLPPGEYSLFTKKDALYYANNFDGDNHIAPVKVVSRKVTQVNVNIDYDAVY
ncbi:MAG TPA: hypothetical protein VK711_08745 [Puia sp.]|jgi:hypothetical protein|nr:hypothetical protein [Puia sp.]